MGLHEKNLLKVLLKNLSTTTKASVLVGATLLVAACGTQPASAPPSLDAPVTSAPAPESPADLTSQDLITATSTELSNPEPQTPDNLKDQLKAGGLVIIHRYTGSGGANIGAAPAQFIDDGQRISESSIAAMNELEAKYLELEIPVGQMLSSEYYFVYQHAMESVGDATGKEFTLNRDLTGSFNFRDPQELEQSLQNLRNRTVTLPQPGTNTVLFTHQGKFEKAYGYYLQPGWTIIFKPDGSGNPQVLASMPLEEFLAL